ncbi:8512_t:CDS:2 [Paraglomus occultum]|uniref:8512_t:CDS:1 n=1 Tax=Paraglomus occultum TaxID=144539 RepID=A0A9N9BD58_9GLOM|nr:8512_t:CDS:2 [Paraglomus occultum]
MHAKQLNNTHLHHIGYVKALTVYLRTCKTLFLLALSKRPNRSTKLYTHGRHKDPIGVCNKPSMIPSGYKPKPPSALDNISFTFWNEFRPAAEYSKSSEALSGTPAQIRTMNSQRRHSEDSLAVHSR